MSEDLIVHNLGDTPPNERVESMDAFCKELIPVIKRLARKHEIPEDDLICSLISMGGSAAEHYELRSFAASVMKRWAQELTGH